MKRLLLLLLPFLAVPTPDVWAGSYTDSAHGSFETGVFRSEIGSAPPVEDRYSRGNCAHCHEQHASIAGSEPDPVTGPSAYALFAPNFNTARQTNSYAEADDFCFYCHNSSGSAQQVTNYSYSRNFGCGSLGPESIMGAMNQRSYHNLYDILVFARDEFPSWFRDQGNPCSACHNPHLARRNWYQPQDPAYSAIARPDDHFSLWGTTETMAASYNTKYEPPLCSNSLTDREPAASADAAAGRENTPDYVAFCTACHNNTNTIYSTTLTDNVRKIDWTGDKHGERDMDGEIWTKSPYATSGDFVLSCTDCHEPHGSANVMLIRTRVNADNLQGTITRFDSAADDSNVEWGYLCMRCHEDDAENGDTGDTGNVNAWESVHHRDADAPYDQTMCGNCHSGPMQQPINCDQCHFHGAVIPVTTGTGGTRRAF